MNLKKIASLFLLVIVCWCDCHAQSFNKAKMDSLLDAVANNNRGMGSLAITQNGNVIYQRAIGYAKLDGATKIAADVKTKYRIGSISKMFTATMVFQLIEEGKLSLTTPLAKFYPQFPNANKITIGMMLQHRSGLHNFTNDPAFLTYLAQPKSHQEMLAIMAAPKPDFEPDTKADYSNTNFVLLGYIVEQLTQKTYAEAVKQRVALKAGLSDTYYGGKISTANHEAYSYELTGNEWKPAIEADMSIPGGAGGIVSTPTDLNKFAGALFAGKLISAKSLATMQTIKDHYGMGMISTPFAGHQGYGHTGGIDGFGSQVIYFPDDKVSIAYIHNGDANAMGDILVGAMSIYFNKPYTIPNYKLQIKPEDLDKYLGEYSSASIPLKITISKNVSTLIAQAAGQSAFALAPISPNVFESKEISATLKFDPEKKQFTLTQGGGTFIFTKGAGTVTHTPAFAVNPADLDKYPGVYATTAMPLKITIAKQGETLTAQGTGQSAFPLNPIAPHTFEFKPAAIEIGFDPAKNQMTLKQGTSTTIFTKEK